LQPVKSDSVRNVYLAPRPSKDNFAFRYSGYVQIPTDGMYTFHLTSNDGSKLYIGSQEIIDNDGIHQAAGKTAAGTVALKAGFHPLTLTYFDAQEREALSLVYEGPDIKKQRIPDTALFHRQITPWHFAVIADNRGGSPAHRQIMKYAQQFGSDIILNIGDMVHPTPGHLWNDFIADMDAVFARQRRTMLNKYFVSVGGWEEQYINCSRRKAAPLIRPENWTFAGKLQWPGYEPDNAAGQAFYDNYFKYRERAGKRGSSILDYDQFGDYYVHHRNLHILSLYISDEWHRTEKFHPEDDPSARARAWKKQIAWLGAHLARIRTDDPTSPILVMAHDGGWLNQKGDSFRGRLCALLEKHNVDIALCGDGHRYYHYSDPTTLKLMVPALTGYLKITVGLEQLTVEHRDRNDHLLNAFEKQIAKPNITAK